MAMTINGLFARRLLLSKFLSSYRQMSSLSWTNSFRSLTAYRFSLRKSVSVQTCHFNGCRSLQTVSSSRERDTRVLSTGHTQW